MKTSRDLSSPDDLSPPATGIAPISVLLVQVETRRRRICQRALERRGYLVDAVADGEEAWETIQKKPYDLIVTDNEMPRMSGLELSRRLRREGVNLPVIMITSCVASLLDQDLSSIGFAAVLVNPFSTADLQSAVERALPRPAGAARTFPTVRRECCAFHPATTQPGR